MSQPVRHLTEDGVTFKSHLDGSKQYCSERSTEIQHLLGATITWHLTNVPHFPPLNRWRRIYGIVDALGKRHGQRSGRVLVWSIFIVQGLFC